MRNAVVRCLPALVLLLAASTNALGQSLANGLVADPCPRPEPAAEARTSALAELFLTPTSSPEAFWEAFAELQAEASAEEQSRIQALLAADWANLCRYKTANAALAGAPRVVFMGDSITEGWVRGDPALFTDGIVGRGIGGQTSPQMLVRFWQDVVALRPRAVHIMAGTNDIAGNTGPTTARDYQSNILAMVELARSNGIAVILAGIPPSRNLFWRGDFDPRASIRDLNAWLRNVAAEQGLVFVDYGEVLADAEGGLRADLANDGVHPNRTGYAGMRPLAERAIATALQRGGANAAGVKVEPNGTVHMPAQAVPISSFLSAEAQAYLAEHLLQVQRPEMLVQENGVPRLLVGYLDRQRELFAVEREETTIGGVHAYVYTPADGIARDNRDRVLIDLHGGGFSGCWPACAELESMPIAALGRIKVVSLDYRQGPEHRHPAASEDVAAAYRELLKTYRPENIGLYGCSAGGMLAGMSVAWFRRHGLPRPGAIGMLCAGAAPAAVAFGGDANYTTMPLGESRAPPAPASPEPAVQFAYFAGADPNDPLVSPAASPEVLAQFPPTLIVTGTRAFELSNAVYTHTQLVKLGVDAALHVWEGMFHGFFYNPDVPESRECYDVIVDFFDSRLGRR